MGFRDDRVAQHGRIESLEGELDETKAALEAAQAELERLRAPAPPPPPPSFAKGEVVWVRWWGSWYRARVLDVLGSDRFHITYHGYKSSWNETVGLDRIAKVPPTENVGRKRAGWVIAFIVSALVATAAWFALSGPGGEPVHDASELEVGQSVSVLWNGSWFDAEVVAPGADGQVLVHYDGYATRWDESVTLDRVRR